MSITHEILANTINGTKPPAHMAQTLEAQRNADFEAKVKTVVGILEARGYCPVSKLVDAAEGYDLNPQQKAAVNKWLMEHAYAKPKSVEISGKDGGPIPLLLTHEDAGIL